MSIARRAPVRAPLARVRDALLDLQAWPRWNDTIVELAPLEVVRPGLRVRLRQRGTPLVTWKVTDVRDDGFTWELHAVGLCVRADHRAYDDAGDVYAELRLEFDGVFAVPARLFSKASNERAMSVELDGLRAYCERC